MLDYFNANPMLLVAIAVFVVCLIIGFLGDKRLKKENKIGSLLNNTDKNNIASSSEEKDDNDLEDNNEVANAIDNVFESQNTVAVDPDLNVAPPIDSVTTQFDFGTNTVENSSESQIEQMPNINQDAFDNPVDNIVQEPVVNENFVFPAENAPQDIINQDASENDINNIF